MEEKSSLQNCDKDDVLSFTGAMFKVEQLEDVVSQLLSKPRLGEEFVKLLKSKNLNIYLGPKNYRDKKGRFQIIEISPWQWFSDGIDGEILRIGAKGWQKGKVKINLKVSIEFCPDEPDVTEQSINNQSENSQLESSLDDLRQIMNENN